MIRPIASGAGTAIFVDEIGIEVGIVGEFRLRASYQPVFTRRGDLLSAVAVYVARQRRFTMGRSCRFRLSMMPPCRATALR